MASRQFSARAELCPQELGSYAIQATITHDGDSRGACSEVGSLQVSQGTVEGVKREVYSQVAGYLIVYDGDVLITAPTTWVAAVMDAVKPEWECTSTGSV